MSFEKSDWNMMENKSSMHKSVYRFLHIHISGAHKFQCNISGAFNGIKISMIRATTQLLLIKYYNFLWMQCDYQCSYTYVHMTRDTTIVTLIKLQPINDDNEFSDDLQNNLFCLQHFHC